MNKEKALKILGEYMNSDGSFSSNGHFIQFWSPGGKQITLNADFMLEHLEALAWLMRNSTEENPVVPQ